MKKSFILLAACALAGVAVTAAGCANSSRNLASLSSNWYYDNSFREIQPTFTQENADKFTYKVTQTEASRNGYYSVQNGDGEYTTEFYAKKITADGLTPITAEKWRDGYVSALGSDGYMFLYYYKTELTIPSVTFTFNEESVTFNNQTVVSESYFMPVAEYLAPVYTVREVHRAVPTDLQVGALKDCYAEINMKYESFYSLYGGNVLSHITDLSKENAEPSDYEVGGLTGYTNSVFDYTYLDIVVRAMRGLYSSSALSFTLYTPGLQPRDYTVSVGDKALLSDAEKSAAQLAEVQAVLEGKNMFTPQPVEGSETGEVTKLKTKSATVSYSGGSFSGVSQTYWFAVGDKNNETRTVMVKYSEPIVYGLGTLEYVLTQIG